MLQDHAAKLLSVSMGGALGTAARYLATIAFARWLGPSFPYGTLFVNVVGSFVLSFVMQLIVSGTAVSPNLQLALTVGFTGGFTTYSAFNHQLQELFEAGAWAKGAIYVLLTLVASFVAGLMGLALARAWIGEGG